VQRGHITIDDAYREARDTTLIDGYVQQLRELEARQKKK